MKKRILFLVFVFTTFVNAECFGKKFFTGAFRDFWPNLYNVCLSDDEPTIRTSLSKQLTQIFHVRNKRFSPYVHDLEVWSDSISFNQWFNDGNWPYSGIFKSTYEVRDIEKIKPLYPFYFGIHVTYVGSRIWKDTVMAFTFYTGESNRFKSNATVKHGPRQTVRGLFDIAISTKNFTNDYYTYVLDTLGYGRSCSEYEYNCSYMDGRLRFIKVQDKDVLVVFDPNSERIHIRRNSNVSWELADAMQENIKLRIDAANSIRDKTLLER